MVDHCYYDYCTSCGRCIQLWYVEKSIYITNILLSNLVFYIVVDLAVYPGNIFSFLLVIGLILIRRHRKTLSLPRPEYYAWHIAVAFALLTNLYMLVAPWYPPEGGANGGDVSFWYGTYMVTSIGLYVFSFFSIPKWIIRDATFIHSSSRSNKRHRLIICGLYYCFWIKWLPRHKNYQLRQTVLEFEDGTITHKLVKVPNAEVAQWDEEHDAVGRLRHRPVY